MTTLTDNPREKTTECRCLKRPRSLPKDLDSMYRAMAIPAVLRLPHVCIRPDTIGRLMAYHEQREAIMRMARSKYPIGSEPKMS